MFTMLGQVTLQFAAAGLQFWTISYLQVVLGVDPILAQSTFVVTLVSAMVPGIILGATLSDYFGGYKGKGMANSLSLCIAYGTFAMIFAFLLSSAFEYESFTVLMWLFFFAGAGIMPIAQGIIIGCVPKFA